MDDEKKKSEFLKNWADRKTNAQRMQKGFNGAPKQSELGKAIQSAFAYVTGSEKKKKVQESDS